MSLESKSFWIPDYDLIGSKTKLTDTDVQMIELKEVKSFQDNLEKLYTFVCQGATQSSDDMAKSAFVVLKYRMELLFPELVK